MLEPLGVEPPAEFGDAQAAGLDGGDPAVGQALVAGGQRLLLAHLVGLEVVELSGCDQAGERVRQAATKRTS